MSHDNNKNTFPPYRFGGLCRLGESHAESRALSFCAASQPGETAEKVISRLQQEHDQATAFRRENSLAVVYGKSSQYVCDIRFKGDQVATAAVTSLN